MYRNVRPSHTHLTHSYGFFAAGPGQGRVVDSVSPVVLIERDRSSTKVGIGGTKNLS